METRKITIIIIITILVLIIVIFSNRGMVSQSLKDTHEEFDYGPKDKHKEFDYGTCKCVNGELLSNNCKYPFQHPVCPPYINGCYCEAHAEDFESQDCDSLTDPSAKFLCEKRDEPDEFLFFSGCDNRYYHTCLDDGRMLHGNGKTIYDPKLGYYCLPRPDWDADNPDCRRPSRPPFQ